ncbi:MAG: Gfo/Idh/MocA family oxidoreductase, partial [Actinomycetota bacterium]
HDPLGYDIRMELFGSRDSISVGLDERTPLRSVEPSMRPFEGPPYPDFQRRFEDAYRAEVATFLEVAAGREDNPCTAKDAFEALRIATACHVSAHERRPVGLEEIA